MVRDAFPAWTRRPAGLLLLALLLGACGAASADTGASSSSEAVPGVERVTATVRPCSYGGTALGKVARAPSGPATDAFGAIRHLAGVAAAGQKLTSVDLATAAAAGVQVPASGAGAAVKIATPAGSGAARVSAGASAVPAEPCA